MPHANATLTAKGRLALARCVVVDGWSLRRAAERFQVSHTCAGRWADRLRALEPGADPLIAMQDRPSRPRRSPNQLRRPLVRQVLHLRRKHGWGPARIGHRLGLRPSTVHRVLRREGEPLLAELDLATRRQVRGTVQRYEHTHPGDLVHVDIKKLGRIPDGGGHRIHGRSEDVRGRGNGYGYVHTALDDHSRLAYSEVLADETAATTVAWWRRAVAWFAEQGVVIKRVLTDNGSCYRSTDWHTCCAELGITVKKTRPYRPQTNGKVERFHRTLTTEWAYARLYSSDDARTRALRKWQHHYNHHRTHTALGGLPPASRVTNLSGQNT